MADEIDIMFEREQAALDAQIAMRKHVPTPTGACFNCNEPLPIGVYCDADCRHDHEQRQRFQQRTL